MRLQSLELQCGDAALPAGTLPQNWSRLRQLSLLNLGPNNFSGLFSLHIFCMVGHARRCNKRSCPSHAAFIARALECDDIGADKF
jgi:hypothetical protein